MELRTDASNARARGRRARGAVSGPLSFLVVTAGLLGGLAFLGTDEAATDGAPAEERVRPGLVQWHEGGYEAAVAAAARSGKRVLLFQLLGSLDDAFC